MVKLMGHLAFGLLFALPAWFLWRRRVAGTFVGLALLTSSLPDVDLWLARWFPGEVHHHGVTHTVVFVVLVSLLAGAVAAALLTRPLDDWLGWGRFDRTGMFGFAFLAFFLGGSSHVFADMLSAPDISTPIEPFWPVITGSWGVDVIYYENPLWNVGFLLLMGLVHVATAYLVEPRDHRLRLVRRAN